jgi:hypothetical protein
MTRLLLFIIAGSVAACSIIGEPGSVCGGAQVAVARATLPDTGIAAGTELLVVLSQYDPYLIGEETELAIQPLPQVGREPSPDPDPRVRLVREDGRVLVDTLSSRAARPSWIVYKRFRNAELRIAIFEAIQRQALWVELWSPVAQQSGTRIRLTTESAEVQPVTRCL